MKKILVLGASGEIGPEITPGLSVHCDLRLSDIATKNDQGEVLGVDITSYDEVLSACQGVDAILNLCVIRNDPTLSFDVNTIGVYNIMEAALACGITRVVHTGPQSDRQWFDHHFDVDSAPVMGGSGYYCLTKYLGMEISQMYSHAYGIDSIWFLFNGLGPKPSAAAVGRSYPVFTIVYEDLVHAIRLALEVEEIPGHYQHFNLLSYLGHGKFSIDKARRLLGFEPLEKLEGYFTRPT